MVGLIVAIIIFNIIAFKTNKRMTLNQIIHIWTFTIVFHLIFDVFINIKYKAYWYFTQEIDWHALPAYLVLLPPVCMLFINGYPFNRSLRKQLLFLFYWEIGILAYEFIALLPDPWGYFHYGWWSIWHSAIINPFLFLILLGYYKYICKLEKVLIQGIK